MCKYALRCVGMDYANNLDYKLAASHTLYATRSRMKLK